VRRIIPAVALAAFAAIAFAIGLTNCGSDGGGARDAGSDDGGGGSGRGDGTAADLAVPVETGPCTSGMALVTYGDGGIVCVDRFEAATVVVAPDGGTAPHPYDQPVDAVGNGLTIAAVVADGIKPQGYISEVQAASACANAGKRLCTLAEWLGACQGPNGYTYPYGNTYMAGACNEGRATNPVNDCFGSGNVFTYNNMNSSCCDDQPNTVAPGGMFDKCVSSWGIYDLHGNLHEWIATQVSSGNGIFKGGFFVDATLNGAGCLYATTAHAQSYHDYSTGFRCCADPK
jgi:sulfatase-modifying factor enzyme 1